MNHKLNYIQHKFVLCPLYALILYASELLLHFKRTFWLANFGRLTWNAYGILNI